MTEAARLLPADENELRAEIERLAAALGCEVLLLPRDETRATALRDAIERCAEELGQRVIVEAPSPAPPAKAAAPPRFQVTERDIEVLRAVARYRFLRTGQVHRLLFAPTSSPQMARRRLRLLASDPYRYLGKAEFILQQAGAPRETAYYLTPAGQILLGDIGDDPPNYPFERQGRVRHRFLEHALEVAEFRLKLELGLRGKSHLRLQRFVADFEVKEHLKGTPGKERFKLYHAFPGGARQLVVYPDALLILAADLGGEREQALFFVEIDRGTEGHAVIREKVVAYQRFAEASLHRKFGDFPRFRVLLQTHSPKRAALLRKTLAGMRGEELIWIASAPEITSESLLSGEVWQDYSGRRRRIAF